MPCFHGRYTAVKMETLERVIVDDGNKYGWRRVALLFHCYLLVKIRWTVVHNIRSHDCENTH